MSNSLRAAVACAGIASVLAISSCSGTDGEPEASAAESVATVEPTAAPVDVDPSIPVQPSLAAGIPTEAPPPLATPDPGTAQASVLITLATVDSATGGLMLGGYVSGLIEDGGDCQYFVTRSGGDALTIHQEGVENKGSTSCGSTTVPATQVPSGDYSIVLRYTSAAGQFESKAVEVRVP